MPVAQTYSDGHIIYAANLNASFASSANIQGDTFLGPIFLARDPLISTEAVTKNYVDALITSNTQIVFNTANTGITLATAAFIVANNAFALANIANNTASNSLSIATFANNLVFTVNTIADQANTTATIAFITAQNINNTAVTSLVLAQAAFDQANSSANATGTFLSQAAFDKANASSNTAVASFSKANTSGNVAQAAYNQANTGTVLAQAAFNQANTASGITPVVIVTNSGTTQTIAFPASGNKAYDITQNANCVITLTGGTAGQYQTVILILRQDVTAGHTPTLPVSIKWPGGVTPTPNTLSGHLDVYILSTPDAGTTVIGSY